MYGGNNERRRSSSGQSTVKKPYLMIVEQPAPKALRFRYESEPRSVGSIPGISSTPENKTYPTIRLVGHEGRAVVVVSCVTKDEPYKPHPHNLVGQEGCKHGVCTLEFPQDTMTLQFTHLGVQFVKRTNVKESLKLREKKAVDPFRTGFGHKHQLKTIDFHCVRLCFQVLLEGEKKGSFSIPLAPVVSNPIINRIGDIDFMIVKLSECVSYPDGGNKEIIILCEGIDKEDVQVKFYEEKDGTNVWEGFADIRKVYKKNMAISFNPPRYRTLDITEPVKVFIQLQRSSDGETSEPLPFEFIPMRDQKRKRPKFENMLDMCKEIGIDRDPLLESIGESKQNILMWPELPVMLESDSEPIQLPSLQSTPSPVVQGWNIPYTPTSMNLPLSQTETYTPSVDCNDLFSLLDLDSLGVEQKQTSLNTSDLSPLLTFSHTLTLQGNNDQMFTFGNSDLDSNVFE